MLLNYLKNSMPLLKTTMLQQNQDQNIDHWFYE